MRSTVPHRGAAQGRPLLDAHAARPRGLPEPRVRYVWVPPGGRVAHGLRRGGRRQRRLLLPGGRHDLRRPRSSPSACGAGVADELPRPRAGLRAARSGTSGSPTSSPTSTRTTSSTSSASSRCARAAASRAVRAAGRLPGRRVGQLRLPRRAARARRRGGGAEHGARRRRLRVRPARATTARRSSAATRGCSASATGSRPTAAATCRPEPATLRSRERDPMSQDFTAGSVIARAFAIVRDHVRGPGRHGAARLRRRRASPPRSCRRPGPHRRRGLAGPHDLLPGHGRAARRRRAATAGATAPSASWCAASRRWWSRCSRSRSWPGLGILVGFILLIVPGLFLLTIWAVVAPVTVLERPGIFAAFGRSRELVRGHGWTVFGALVLVFLDRAGGGDRRGHHRGADGRRRRATWARPSSGGC